MIVSTSAVTRTLVAALSLQQTPQSPASDVSTVHAKSANVHGVGYNTTPRSPSSVAAQNRAIQTQGSGCKSGDYDPPDVETPRFAPYDQKVASIYRYRKQLSVNLGSWFVLENWMTPSLFSCASGPKASELDVANGWDGLKSSQAALERHWDIWITEDDFVWLRDVGINTVRIPIGYWTLGPRYCQGTSFEGVASVYARSWPRVLRAIEWAAKYNIGVLVDLHGAPGSQNGQSHSGVSDGKVNLFDEEDNIQKTIDTLTYLTEQLVPISNVVGIQVLNEPNDVVSLPKFYGRVIDTLRKISPEAERFPFYIHDGFNLQRFAEFVGKRKDFVVQDHHSYFVFTSSDASKPAKDHTSNVNSAIQSALSSVSKQARHNLVVDEWSCALTPQSLSSESKKLAARKSFCSSQADVYLRTTAGWSFWSYKTENCDSEDGWCFRKAVGRSLPSKFSSWDGSGKGDGNDNGNGVMRLSNAVGGVKEQVIGDRERSLLTRVTEQDGGLADEQLGGTEALDDHTRPTLDSNSPKAMAIDKTISASNPLDAMISDKNVELGLAEDSTPVYLKPPSPGYTTGRVLSLEKPPKASSVAGISNPKGSASTKASSDHKMSMDSPVSNPTEPHTSKDETNGWTIPLGPSAPNADDMIAASVVPDTDKTVLPVNPSSGRDDLVDPTVLSFGAIVKRVFGLSTCAIGSGTTVARRAAQQESGNSETKEEAQKSRDKPDDRGYQDGYTTALGFGEFGGSRLGFATQYMEDRIIALLESKGLRQEEVGDYRKSFVEGLADGETKVMKDLIKEHK